LSQYTEAADRAEGYKQAAVNLTLQIASGLAAVG
jgi:hypothetical protein